ncbi:MAG: Xaa-Pro peptidase family protein [Gemmatimonadota bacterium]|nr:Xaa-Pro peptidase family protein [Gemmatimonadota bacterium]
MRRRYLSATLIALVAFSATLGAQINQSEYQARRAKLAAKIDSVTGGQDWVLYASGGEEPVQDYLTFNQKPRFEYLTGFHEPSAGLVLVHRKNAPLRQILFVQPRDASREVWTGNRLGPSRVQNALGMEGRDSRSLPAALDTLLGADTTLYLIGDASDGTVALTADDVLLRAVRTAHSRLQIVNASRTADALRRTKSPAELDFIRKAVAITVDAQHAAFQTVRPGINEFEVQAIIEYTFRKNGADRPSFSSIVGSGPNSTQLHYLNDDRFIQNGDVVVMDIGASYRGYAADVTRTVPANGVYSNEQREIYQAVRDAQKAGERQATLGNDSRRMSDSATKSISSSMARLGLIEAPDSTYDCTDSPSGICPQYRLYYMHSLGHPIGLEVHDTGLPGRAGGILAPGDAFTIEPGIYVRGNTLDIIPDTPRNRRVKDHIRAAVMKYANIGVRIEDDYIMTDNGVDWISRAPREMSEIEAIMKSAPKTIAGRDSAKVEWYRSTDPHGLRAP